MEVHYPGSLDIWLWMKAFGIALPGNGSLLDQDEALMHDLAQYNAVEAVLRRNDDGRNK